MPDCVHLGSSAPHYPQETRHLLAVGTPLECRDFRDKSRLKGNWLKRLARQANSGFLIGTQTG